MSRKYKFRNPDGLYFVTFTVINWIDFFIRPEYHEVILESWKYCQINKSLRIHAWCIMTSHVHMIISSENELSAIMRDMKSNTSRQLRKALSDHPSESRREWILRMMKKEGIENGNNKDFQFWQQNNHPIELVSNFMLEQKLNYIHMNPVKAGFIQKAEHYIYSSAKDYCGEKGLIEIEKIY